MNKDIIGENCASLTSLPEVADNSLLNSEDKPQGIQSFASLPSGALLFTKETGAPSHDSKGYTS